MPKSLHTPIHRKSVAAPAHRKKADRKGMAGGQAKNHKPQSKLKVSRKNDPYERQADHVADQVVNTSGRKQALLAQQVTPLIQRKAEHDSEHAQLVPEEEYRGTESVQTKEEEMQVSPEVQEMQEEVQEQEETQLAEESLMEEEDLAEDEEEGQMKEALPGSEDIQKEEELQAMEETAQARDMEEAQAKTEEEAQLKSDEVQEKESEETQSKAENIQERPFFGQKPVVGPGAPSIKQQLAVSKGQGQTLPKKIRQEMETAFGVDFGEVNLHTDAAAIRLSKALGAQAFAHGKDIYFNTGKFDPDSRKGKHLIAHELTHTIQQGAVQQSPGGRKPPTLSSLNQLHLRQEAGTEDSELIDRKEEHFPESGEHRVSPEKENKFEERGYELYDAIKNEINELPSYKPKGHYTSGAAGGDSSSLKVYNPWFDQLQSLLINLDFWGKHQQDAQEHLVEYAIYRTAAQLGGKDKIPPNILWMLQRIGLSEMNDSAIAKYNRKLNKELGPGNEVELPRTGSDFRAPMGSENWCAYAQTLALKNTGWQQSKARYYKPGEQLVQGDILTVITSKGPASGHVVSVINHKNDRIDVVSGNAGGGKGSVRIDSVTIETPPSAYNYEVAHTVAKGTYHTATNPSKPGTVWVIKIVPIESISGEIERAVPEYGPDEFEKILAGSSGSSGGKSGPAQTEAYDPASAPAQPSPYLTADEAGEKTEETSEKGAEADQGKKEEKEGDAPIAESPKTPEDDPDFQAIKAEAGTVKTKQKKHGVPVEKAVAAQKASSIPQELDISSQAQFHQVGRMDKQEAKPFEATAFEKDLMDRVEKALPDNNKEVKEKFKDNPRAGKEVLDKAQSDMGKDVKEEQKNAGNAIAKTTAAPPSTEGTTPKEVVPMQGEHAGKKPHIAKAETAAPKPRTDQEISMEKQAQSLDDQMAENKVTEDQLQKSNEPAFTEALGHKNKAQEEARNAPAEYRAKEEPQLEKAKADAKGDVMKGLGNMFGARSGQFAQVQNSKTGTKSKDETKRKEVANKLKEIYGRTKESVETKLKRLEEDVVRDFDQASERAMATFKANLDRRLDDYFSFWNSGERIADWVSGELDQKAHEIFESEKWRFIRNLKKDVARISKKVADGLNDAQKTIDNGKKEVDVYWKSLSPELKKLAQDAKDQITGQFSQLEQSVHDFHDRLNEKLANKFIEHVNKLKDIFEKMKKEKEGWLEGAFNYMEGVIKTIMELKDMLLGILAKAKDSIMKIIDDPVQFLKNLIAAVKLGLDNFVKNIVKHLKKGFLTWLLGAMPPGIEFPKKWNLMGIFKFVMSVLGLTWANIRSRAVKKLGEPVVKVLEEMFKIFKIIHKEGLSGLWKYIKQKIGDLKVMVLDAIKNFLIEKVVMAGIQWVIGLLNPAGAFIKACKLIYDIIMFFVNHGKRIITLINSIVNGIADIVAGKIKGAAKLVEDSLAKVVPIAIGFLASLLGLGGLSEKVQAIIDKIRAPINKAIDWVLDKAIGFAKKMGIFKLVNKVKGGINKVKEKVKEKAGQLKEKAIDILQWWKTSKSYKAKDGKKHKLYFKGKGDKAELTIASYPTSYKQFFKQFKDSDLNQKQKDAKTDGIEIAKQIAQISSRKLTGKTEKAKNKERKQKRKEIDQKLEILWPHTSELLSGKDAPTGLTKEEAIPIKWPKPMDLYQPVVLKEFPEGEQKFDWHTRVPLPLNRMGQSLTIGLQSSVLPKEGKIVKRLNDYRGTNSELFKVTLRDFGFEWAGLQPDHVQELQFSGPDEVYNLWPLDSSANQSAGSRLTHQIVQWKNDKGEVVAIKTNDKLLVGRYFKIKEVGL